MRSRLLRAVTDPAPAGLPVLSQGAVHLRLVLAAGRIGLNHGVGGKIEDGGVETTGVTVAEILTGIVD